MIDETRVQARPGNWSAPSEQLALSLRQPVMARMDDLGLIAARGPDAAAFLNGQLTVDMTRIGPQQWQLGACCSPKGRVQAVFECWHEDDGFFMIVPSGLAGALLGRLSRFVLRAKVKLADETGQWRFYGLTGPHGEQALQEAGLACPDAVWTQRSPCDGAHLARLPASPSCGARFLLAVSSQADEALRTRWGGFAEVDPAVWWWSKIDAGLPDVFEDTQERFVPQMLNLDVLGGVHFGKGCYPGQEVIARSQYLGKLRRRMTRAHAAQARAGQDVLAGDGSGAPAGTVVMSATAPSGGVDLLLECPTEMMQAGRLRMPAPGSPELTVLATPYAIINPTE